MLRLALLQHFQAAIGRAIIDGHDFVRPRRLVQRLRDFVEKDGDVFFLVVHGKNDGEIGRRHQRGSVTPNALSKFAVVWAATSSSGTPHSVASSSATFTTYAG